MGAKGSVPDYERAAQDAINEADCRVAWGMSMGRVGSRDLIDRYSSTAELNNGVKTSQ